MIDHTLRAAAFSLLASTALASPAFAQAAATETAQPAQEAVPVDPANAPSTQTAPEAAPDQDSNIIIVTAQKREENLQNVPISVQAIGTRRLDQLNIANFEDYTKQLPSVSFQTSQPGSTTVYMRGVATGGDGVHSGSLPSVGFYLDEQPVTTIGGTLDVHIYDIARIESLAGPQGTLYGASSQAGTIRIITNKPELGVMSGRIDGEINSVAHGGMGGSLEGMINLPVSDNMAFRAVAFYRHDGGYIDNVFGERTYVYEGNHGPPFGDKVFDNSDLTENNFNDVDIYGGRAALKIDLNDNWTVTPTIMHQNTKANGVFFTDKDQGDLEVQRFRSEKTKDKFTQAALTIEGKLANFDVTYAGAYMHRPTSGTSDYTDYTDAYENYYNYTGCDLNDDDVTDFTSLLDCQNYVDNNGNLIDPRQHIFGSNNFKKMSHEFRIASPQDKRFRVIAGAFYQRQTNDILQDYQIDNLADVYSVPDRPGTVWLTKQKRKDKDYALFGEASFDITPQITITGGGRLFKYDNTLVGFAGFGFEGGPGGFGSGVKKCLTVNGLEFEDDLLAPFAPGGVSGTPCTNVGDVVDGEIVPKRSKGNGFTHRLNAQYKPTDDLMFYATWSRGFRPGGINRQPGLAGYEPDYLTNYELGWKTTFGRFRWNGAIYHQIWKKLQFTFLGENSLSVIQNGRDAKIDGIETDVGYQSGGLTLNAAAAYTNARTKGNICDSILADEDCTGDTIVTPSGTRLPVTPKLKMAATGRYAWPVSIGRAHVQASISHQGSASGDIRRDIGSYGVISPNPNDVLGRIKASTLVDLFVGFDWQKYSIEAFATNVFDQRNELSRFVSCNAFYCDRLHIVPGRPRLIGLRAGAKF